MFNEGLKEFLGMTNKSLNNAESGSVSMIVNLDESEDVDVDIEAEAEHEITEDTRKCYWALSKLYIPLTIVAHSVYTFVNL